ncbi:hypothetical protein AUC45_10610 [Erythrobacter sp. YT30]|nr:hypothetical protein AUC45_10610 [Erythrobacter sp. YT30]
MSEQAQSTFWRRYLAFMLCSLVFVAPMLVLEKIGLRSDWVSIGAFCLLVAFCLWNRSHVRDRFSGMALPTLILCGSATMSSIGWENEGSFFEVLYAVGLIGIFPALLFLIYRLSGIQWLFRIRD